ncbi:MAG: hypothetical protein ABIJ35_05980 [Acidobacteriota bacterium]
MKKTVLFISLCSLTLFPGAQQVRQDSSFVPQSLVINVEVPVRVFQSDRFVENLTINDFDVFENGIRQDLDAVYLVKKNAVTRSDENRRFLPQTQRHFYLFFQITEYDPRLEQGLRFFFENIIVPGDNVFIVTPLKTYRMREKTLEVKSRKDIIEEVRGLLRKDTMIGYSDYRNAVNDLAVLSSAMSAKIQADVNQANSNITSGDLFTQTFTQGLSGLRTDGFSGAEYSRQSLDEMLIFYEGLLSKLNVLREINSVKIVDFAKHLKEKDGQKYVFLFYEREFIPTINETIINQYMTLYQDNPYIQQTLASINNFFKRDIPFDINNVKQIYSDSASSIHFLFVTRPRQLLPGVTFTEQSEDVYSAFREMALATGGYFESAFNPAKSFSNALNAAENYYLLYYTPKNYVSDGSFRNIEVKLKSEISSRFRVVHKAGYFRD